MRLAAEFDNYKKRTGREFNLIVKNANETLITSLLPALDNLGRALQAPQTSEETRTFAEGVVMIRQQFLDVLLNEGLQEIEANRQMFDPARHEALMTVERDDVPAGTIIEVVEKGYTLNDKVIRPAKTLVSRSSVSEQS
jgi:molecular chaperone GrpE